jgi:hypothetical protein
MAKLDKKLAAEQQAEEEKKAAKGMGSQEFTKQFFKKNKTEVLNGQPTITHIVSTGSLKLDILTGGGIGPGFTRLVGQNSGGKTSEGLMLMYNFFEAQAEGRLSNEIIARSGITFVTDPDEWVPGTCLVFEGNTYESVADYIKGLLTNNPEGNLYFFLVDSLDGLILRDDRDKDFQDSFKVAGPAVIGKKLMQHVALPLVKFGHILVMTSQVTAQPKIDPYAKVEPRLFAASGGNALLHYADNIWEFLPRYQDDRILADPSQKYNYSKNPIIGHLAKIIVRKSNNEKNEDRLSYPIKYRQTGATSIWIEREVGDILLAYRMIISGAWYSFPEDLHKELLKIDPNVPGKVQGTSKLYELLENNKALTKFLFNYLRNALISAKIAVGEGDPLAEETDSKEKE